MNIQLFNEDCLETMKRIPDYSIDLILQDPPYGTTQNDWDVKPDLQRMWFEWERIIKGNGAIIFTAAQPFASELVLSRSGFFRYDLIWEKSIATGFLNANRQPLRSHEHILVFSKSQTTYNPQKIKLKHASYKKNRTRTRISNNYGDYDPSVPTGCKSGERYPRSVISFQGESDFFDSSKGSGLTKHPTQKPLDLFRYLIKTYSNKGETVFDGYSGSGTTAAACVKEQRNFIGSEINEEYYQKSIERIEREKSQLVLF